MLDKEVADKAAQFSCCAGIERIAERNKAIPVSPVNTYDQLAVHAVLFLVFSLYDKGL